MLDLYYKVPSFYSLRPLSEHLLPQELAPGESWSGWFESSRPLNEDAVAFLGVFGYLRRQTPDGLMAHITHDRTRPFISLVDEVTVKPLPGLASVLAWPLAMLRCAWRLEFLGFFVGLFAGVMIDGALGTRPLFFFLCSLFGLPAAYYLKDFFQRKRSLSHAAKSRG